MKNNLSRENLEASIGILNGFGTDQAPVAGRVGNTPAIYRTSAVGPWVVQIIASGHRGVYGTVTRAELAENDEPSIFAGRLTSNPVGATVGEVYDAILQDTPLARVPQLRGRQAHLVSIVANVLAFTPQPLPEVSQSG